MHVSIIYRGMSQALDAQFLTDHFGRRHLVRCLIRATLPDRRPQRDPNSNVQVNELRNLRIMRCSFSKLNLFFFAWIFVSFDSSFHSQIWILFTIWIRPRLNFSHSSLVLVALKFTWMVKLIVSFALVPICMSFQYDSIFFPFYKSPLSNCICFYILYSVRCISINII